MKFSKLVWVALEKNISNEPVGAWGPGVEAYYLLGTLATQMASVYIFDLEPMQYLGKWLWTFSAEKSQILKLQVPSGF